MRDDEFERALFKEEEILPTSGFTAAVMEAVRREAATPQPIPFPWKRALPGAMVLCLTIGWVLYEGIMQGIQGNVSVGIPTSFPPLFASVLASPKGVAVCWIAVALALSLVSLRLSRVLTRSSTV